ncbi:MAG: indole-3-glycerol phosphate synthase TrpC [Myxococcota bacterium]
MPILDEIIRHKRRDLERAKAQRSIAEQAELAEAMDDRVRGFRAALLSAPRPRVIAEIKRRSPSRGEIRSDLDPVACAKACAEAGAAALSVLTDERYFGGRLEFLQAARGTVSLPLLRKDFIVDSYQVDEARVGGADAVLLITSVLSPSALGALRERAGSLGLDALVEVHDEGELKIALDVGADLIGINNRDLQTFEVDLGVTEKLAAAIPEGVVVVAESGIFCAGDMERLEGAGAQAFLVGEVLMREDDIGLALRRLRRGA